MEIEGFDWDAGNRDKCRKHGVSLVEIEEALRRCPVIAPDRAHSVAETRFIAVGRTLAGRRVFVAFTLRTKDGRRLIRPISARYMRLKERLRYEAQGPDLQDRLGSGGLPRAGFIRSGLLAVQACAIRVRTQAGAAQHAAAPGASGCRESSGERSRHSVHPLRPRGTGTSDRPCHETPLKAPHQNTPCRNHDRSPVAASTPSPLR